MNRHHQSTLVAQEKTSILKPVTLYDKTIFSELPEKLDVVLITHPRDEDDLPRLFPWAKALDIEERDILTKCIKPVFGEIILNTKLNIGILFLPVFAREMMNPYTRSYCRKILQTEALDLVASSGAKTICLGGLTGTLTNYGKQITKYAENHDITITTGHSVTAISVYRTYLRAINDLDINPSSKQVTVLGLGSVGNAFVQLLLARNKLPETLILIDKPNRREYLERLFQELKTHTDINIELEFTNVDGSISDDSKMYNSAFIISAVSNPNIIDIEKVSPYTVLIDDSQPYCWSRQKAIDRCLKKLDIVPCEAGLINCNSLGYTSHFPFDFADHDEIEGSHISWSCLTEGIMHYLKPNLPNTLGEPELKGILAYNEAFDELGLTTPILQCGKNVLPILQLKENFKTNDNANK